MQKFQGRSAFWFTYIDDLKIKYFLKFYFSQTLIFTGFFDFDFIECLQVYGMYVTTSFWFHGKLAMDKAKEPASYELAIHTVSF